MCIQVKKQQLEPDVKQWAGSKLGKECVKAVLCHLVNSPGEGIGYPHQYSWTSLVAQLAKNLPAMQEAWGRSLGWEDPLQKGTATHSSILAWRILWIV